LALLRQTAVLLLDRPGPMPTSAPRLVQRLALGGLTLGLAGAAAAACFWGGSALAGLMLLLPMLLTVYGQTKLLRAKLAFDRKGLIRSPLPGHADRLLARLLGIGRPYATLDELRTDLVATRDRPVRVTSKLRLAHLAALATLLLVPGLLQVFVLGRSFNGLAISVLQDEVAASAKALHVLDSGKLRDIIEPFARSTLPGDGADQRQARAAMADVLVRLYSDPVLRRQLADVLLQQRHDLEERLKAVNSLERFWLGDDLNRAKELLEPGRTIDLEGFKFPQFLEAAQDAENKSRHPERLHDYRAFGRDGPRLVPVLLGLILFWPVCWVVWAFLWRGGLVRRAMGLSLVLANGHAALRVQAAWRAFVVWAPLAGLVGLSVWLEAYHPDLERLSWLCWAAAWATLVLYVAVALRSPARGLHDRLAGTYLVPR
jgi:hypothetical protein